MSNNYDSAVNSFYLAYYGRPADPAGLSFWSQQLEDANGDFSAIVSAFATSSEATARFGTEDAATRISTIYEQLFDRAPDSAGLNYWLDALDKGNATLADVAVQMLNGAQGSDANLSALRLQAAESFTASVAAGGIDYNGSTAIEAAQALIKAVTVNASAADIATMVGEAGKLVNAAVQNEAVLDALATGTTLTALFDTARGHADPVGLLQTLADVAAVAAGDPATLDSLLRGGGMAQVLTVMPASATLTDVVKALASGGLAAAVDVVYPSTGSGTSTPAASVHFAFQSVTEGPDDTHQDNVTNQTTGSVTFSYTGSQLSSIATVQYSTDGTHWSSDHVTLDSGTKTVTIADLNLGTMIVDGPFHIDMPGPINDVTTTLYVRALTASGKVISPAAEQDIVFDGHAAAPVVTLTTDSFHGDAIGGASDNISNDGSLTVSGTETGATVEYAVVDPHAPVDNLDWTTTVPVAQEGENGIYVRQIDAAGNASGASYIDFTLDTAKPAAASVALATDSGPDATDHVTNAAAFHITGLDTDTATATAWEYSVDNGAHWIAGGVNDGSGSAELTPANLADGTYTLEVRQYDAAGNVGDASAGVDFTLDTTVPTVSFYKVVGADPDTPNVTSAASADVDFHYTGTIESTDTVQYKIGDGAWQTVSADDINAASHTIKLAGIDLSTSDPTISVHITDQAGNESNIASQAIDGPYTAPSFNVLVGNSALQIMAADPVHAYLTDDNGSTELVSTTGSDIVPGYVGFGAQAAAVTGTLSVGADLASAAAQDTTVYALGTNGDDTLTGKIVYGFGGTDTLNGTSGGDFLNGGSGTTTFHGGLGADGFGINGGNNTLVYDSAADSHVDDGGAAGGFDSILVYEQPMSLQLQLTGMDFDGNGSIRQEIAFAPEDGSGSALLSALNQAYQQIGGHDNTPYLFQFSDGSQFLVAKTDADAAIDSGDYVIQVSGQFNTVSTLHGTIYLSNGPM